MKRLLIALICLVGVAGVALATPSDNSASNQDTQMKNLMGQLWQR